jgi:hypothetical protein
MYEAGLKSYTNLTSRPCSCPLRVSWQSSLHKHPYIRYDTIHAVSQPLGQVRVGCGHRNGPHLFEHHYNNDITHTTPPQVVSSGIKYTTTYRILDGFKSITTAGVHFFKQRLVTSRGMQLGSKSVSVVEKVTVTYYTGSTSARPGYFSRLSPAMPNTVWKTSTISPGRSARPPNSGSYMY